MNTVQTLREAGYHVQVAQDAIGCTDVSSDTRFYIYNPRFLSHISEIESAVSPSHSHHEKERIIVAGLFQDHQEFPFVILSENEYESLMDMLQDYKQAQEKIEAAQQDQEVTRQQFNAFLQDFAKAF